MSNIPKIEKVIKRIIIPQHPELTEFEVKDLFDDMYDSGTQLGQQMLGRQYVVDFITSECLDSKKQMEIDKIKPAFTDDRGEIYDILSDPSIQHITIFTINKDSVRGKHFHKEEKLNLTTRYGPWDDTTIFYQLNLYTGIQKKSKES